MTVSIKPLEWNDDPCPAAKCVFGHYVVNKNYADVELLVGYGRASATGIGRINLEVGATEADLKAAAQADYEARIRSALTTHVQDVAERELKEIATWEDQQAFEAWAQGERYEMYQHPLHYLFTDPKTNAARQGWKAALQFIRDRSAAAPAKQEG